MQIMNGFQVLHKNKIMHRDVKLANIFLQDDKVVIGDFGFAKSGVDITTTKLGTPLTMAPELLNSNGNSYTSKADLWSIGVVFYQMLYGKTPFDAKNYKDLQKKVKEYSGSNLRFAKDIQISQECKDLLIGLMQYDPKKRVEWKEFFNHPLFDLHTGREGEEPIITNSVIHRDNQSKIKQEFRKNKITATPGEISLKNPKDINEMPVKATTRRGGPNEPKTQEVYNQIEKMQELEEGKKNIRSRYFHEKKKIIWIMYTVRKIRNLAKQKNTYKELCEKLMLSACILLRKGLVMNEHTILSLKLKNNIFNMKYFDDFCKTDDVKIVRNFENDDKIYRTFLKQMTGKFSEEVSSKSLKQELLKYQKIKPETIGIVDSVLDTHFQFLRDQLIKLSLKKEKESEYALAVLHFYYAIHSENEFPFLKEGKNFEWKEFELRASNPDRAKDTLNSIKSY